MGLSPERSNESGAAPKATKSGASPSGQLSVVLWAEVSHCRFLPVAPQVLDGNQSVCIGRQASPMAASASRPHKLCEGAAGRSLAAPANAHKKSPHMRAVVPNAELALDNLSNTLAGPQIRRVSGRFRP